jgi:hypothetical protein
MASIAWQSFHASKKSITPQLWSWKYMHLRADYADAKRQKPQGNMTDIDTEGRREECGQQQRPKTALC